MRKRIPAILLTLVLLAALLPAPVRAAQRPSESADPAELVRNSDTEAAREGSCWLVDTMNGNCLAVSNLVYPRLCCADSGEADVELTRLTDWPVNQLLLWEDSLLVSAGERLLTLDLDSAEILDELRFDAPVDRFAVSPDGLYVLSGGAVMHFAEEREKPETVLTGASSFWLEGPDSLCYMNDEATIHTLTLSTGSVSDAPNRASDLGDVPIDPAVAEADGMSITSLREKFPHGKYWNHMPNRGTGMSYNNQNGWTELACPKHNNYCGTSMQTCNGYAPDGKELSYQCWGFADKLSYDATGDDPQKHDTAGCGWTRSSSRSSLSGLKAGDVIRYNKNGNSTYAHNIYVTAVSGDTITYADCNYNGTCVIRWGQTISRSTVYSWFVFLQSHSSEPSPDAETWLFNVNATLDGEHSVNTVDYAVFDFYYNGYLKKADATDFRGWLAAGSSYELRNIRPVEGVLLDLEASSPISGTLNADTELILVLDHYYLNSADEPVKTKLKDLPRQDKWSYRPICWALENGIASGLTETSFGPGEFCTRGQILTFLWNAAGQPEPELTELPFTDVKPTAYCYKAICWALENGITSGLSETEFGPGEACSRAQAVTFLWLAAGSPESDPDAVCPFEDVKPGSYYRKAVLWAVRNGITSGTSETTFSPKRTCTRAEILTFLYKASLLQSR